MQSQCGQKQNIVCCDSFAPAVSLSPALCAVGVCFLVLMSGDVGWFGDCVRKLLWNQYWYCQPGVVLSGLPSECGSPEWLGWKAAYV